LRRLQIERDRALVAVQVLEIRTIARPAHVLDRSVLDLDDVGAEIGELAHTGRTCAHAREIQDAEFGKGGRGGDGRHGSILIRPGPNQCSGSGMGILSPPSSMTHDGLLACTCSGGTSSGPSQAAALVSSPLW